MKINLPKSTKAKIKIERKKLLEQMSKPNIKQTEWEQLNQRYRAYGEMIKPSCRISPDTLLVVLGNLTGIVLVLKHEQLNIVASKAFGLVLRGKI